MSFVRHRRRASGGYLVRLASLSDGASIPGSGMNTHRRIERTAMPPSSTLQTWFITGTSSGFGRAFAEHALARGHKVVATARRSDSLADLVALAPDRVLAVTLDVDVPGAAEAAIQAAVQRFGRIDVLVNNAGYGV